MDTGLPRDPKETLHRIIKYLVEKSTLFTEHEFNILLNSRFTLEQCEMLRYKLFLKIFETNNKSQLTTKLISLLKKSLEERLEPTYSDYYYLNNASKIEWMLSATVWGFINGKDVWVLEKISKDKEFTRSSSLYLDWVSLQLIELLEELNQVIKDGHKVVIDTYSFK